MHASQLPGNVVVRARRRRGDGQARGGGRHAGRGRGRSSGATRASRTSSSRWWRPGATPSPGFDIVDRANALVGQEYAESLAAGLASRMYAGRLERGTATDTAAISVSASTLGNGGQGRPRLLRTVHRRGVPLHRERPRHALPADGARRPARWPGWPPRPSGRAPSCGASCSPSPSPGSRPSCIVWGVTAAVFGADWGDPLGVLLMCVGATAAMCGLGAFLTSFARTPQEAFAASLVVGLVLALLGGNLLPPGALPEALQVLSLGTPNGWALVGFGRLALLHDPASSVVGPFLVLCLIAARDRWPGHGPGAPDGDAVIPIIRVNLRRAVGDRRYLFVATVFPVLFILVTGLLAGSPKEPIGLVHPSAASGPAGRPHRRPQGADRAQPGPAGRRHPAGAGGGRAHRAAGGAGCATRRLRQRVGLDERGAGPHGRGGPARPHGRRGHAHHRDRRDARPHRRARRAQPLLLRGAGRPRPVPRHHGAAAVVGRGRVAPARA